MQTLVVAILLLLQDAKPPFVNPDEVDKAIERASAFLLSQVNGGLPSDVAINSGMGLSYDPLVLYTLMHAGVDRKSAAVTRLADSVLRAKVAKTYRAALTAMALHAVDAVRYREKIAECAQFLVDNQCDNGQWNYGQAYDIPVLKFSTEGSGQTTARMPIKRKNKIGGPSGDNSNSQYAVLGLRACSMASFDFENAVLDKAIHAWEGLQLDDGSWDYGEKGKTNPKQGGFGSMTAGGAASIVILRRLRGHTVPPSPAKNGIYWLGQNFSVSEHPKSPPDRLRFHYYYLYALERLGDAFPTDVMGKHVWYLDGAAWLLREQKNGAWCGSDPGMAIADTCFAVLFLRRATRVATGVEKK